MEKHPFHIFSWREPFLPGLKDFISEITDGFPGNALVITPNRRPWRYLSALYKDERKARVLPKMMAVNDMIVRWSALAAQAPLRSANLLDQVAVLRECVRELAESRQNLATLFSGMDAPQFLPWGIRLANILDEFAIEGIKPANMPNLEGELSAPAAALMERTGALDELYRQKLDERGWTTIGMDHFRVMNSLERIPGYFLPGNSRQIVIAGFYILSGSHEKIFKTLWQAGAHVCLHTDPAIADGSKPDWACAAHAEWLRKWHARTKLRKEKKSGQDSGGPANHFFSGFDFHSQLEEMGNILKEDDKSATAVILGRNETLMPTLHGLPARNVNVSMGYPLERTPLFRLLDDTLNLHVNRFGENYFVSTDVFNIIRHPYFNMLGLAAGGERNSIASLARGLDYEIRKKGRYWEPGEMDNPELCYGAGDVFNKALWHFFELPKGMTTPAGFARAIEDICHFLMEYGGQPWQQHMPLDVEIMYRLLNAVLPALRQNALAHEAFPLATLHAMFTEMARMERIPFEADPVEGLQVMGLLESRLLQFDRVIFMDATDDVLPGNPAQDPLMPDSLRALCGLPDGRRRERQAAYNMGRLCAGAREVFYLWQESAGTEDSPGGRKIRSRFVETPIWKAEQAAPELLDVKGGPVRSPAPPLRISKVIPALAARNRQLDNAIAGFCQNPIYATSLDSYLLCPLQFIWSNIMRLRDNDKNPPAERQLVGTFIHKILEDFYPAPNSLVERDAVLEDSFESRVMRSFNKVAADMRLKVMINYDSYINLKETVPARLREYFMNQPEKIRLLAKEATLAASLNINGKKVAITGKIDRIDDRDGQLYVLDYKTGERLPKNDNAMWYDEEFFGQIEDSCESGNADEIIRLFEELRGRASSMQLPLYILLLENSPDYREKYAIGNAAWIPLRYEGREETLFEDAGPAEKSLAVRNCARALGLVLEHMRINPQFMAQECDACSKCAYGNLCFS